MTETSSAFVTAIEAIVGAGHVFRDAGMLEAYGADALRRGGRADLVALAGSADEVAAIVRQCNEHRVPVVPRGAGTGYTGGAVPTEGGLVLSLERLNRILVIDELNLFAEVEPHVVTGDLQDAVEQVGLFYPPDPASLRQSVIGGNVAECAGGPRAFKYGTTKQYVLGLEAVTGAGEIIRTGGRTVKNVVGYDLTHLIVGSEGTLAIVTKIILRLVPKPAAQVTLRATFRDVEGAVAAVTELLRARVVPAALELVDGDCLTAVASYLGDASLAPEGTGGLLLLEVDGVPAGVEDEARRVEAACLAAGATEVLVAAGREEREALWRVRRELSPSLHEIAGLKFNHDVVVPRGRIPALFGLVARLRHDFNLRIPCFGHAGDGNIHVNMMVDPADAAAIERAQAAQRALFEGVLALDGSISGEHGIGFTKAPYLSLELTPATIAQMKRVKQAFDPNGVLNPGKIFPR